MEEEDTDYGVFFSNLEDGVPQSEIVTLIIAFIFQVMGILVSEKDVTLRHSDPCECNTARIDLHDPELQRRTVEAARGSEDTPPGLVKSGRWLRVDYFRPMLLQKAVGSPYPPRGEQQVNKQKLASERLLSQSTDPLRWALTASSTPQGLHLRKNQKLGNETRFLEFKRGGGDYIRNNMRQHLTKYICAFLNSEGGTLMIGVDDKEVNPDLKVVGVTVRARRPSTLYETPYGEVFIRRDGSVQGPLRTKDIKEWYHQTLDQEYQEKETLLRQQIDSLEVRLGKIKEQQGQQLEIQRTPGMTEMTANTASAAVVQGSSPIYEGSPTASVQAEGKNGLKRSNSKVCAIL